MALKTINDLTADTSPQSTDLVATWDGSASTSKKVTLANVVVGGGGAVLNGNNTFTAASGNPITTTPAAAALPVGISVSSFDNSGNAGPILGVGRNSNGSTPASGSLRLNAGGTGALRYIWVDGSGNARIHTAPPASNAGVSDTAGTVIGAQTSHIDYKAVVGAPVGDAEALALLVAAADTVRRFTYKSGAFNNQEFSGLVLDGDVLARYGQDADAEHPAGKTLNVVTLLGDILLALREIERRLTALEAE